MLFFFFAACMLGCSVYTSDLLLGDHLVVGVDGDVGAPGLDAEPPATQSDGGSPSPLEEGDGSPASSFDAPVPVARDAADANVVDRKPDDGSRDAMLRDQGVPDVGRVDDASMDTPPRVCSVRGGTSVKLTIRNDDSARTIVALWVDTACVERVQSDVAPSTSFQSSSFTGHVWRIRDKATQEVLLDIPPLTRDTTVSIP